MTSTLLSSAQQTFPSGLTPAMKDCFGLHGHYAFGSVAKEKSGVGRKSATSVGLTTDLVHWLQAGKTVAVVRFASKIHRLASAICTASATGLPVAEILNPRPSSTPFHGDLAAFGSGSLRLSLPPALRRADYRCQSADADLTSVRFHNPCRLRRHPLPGELAAIEATSPVIVLPLWFFVFIVIIVQIVWDVINRKGGGCSMVLLLLEFLFHISRQKNAVSLYTVLVLLMIWRLLIIPAFGEILRQ